MGSSDKVGRRKPHAPSESTRRLLERRRRRSRKHGGGAGVVNLLYRLGLTGRGRNTVDTCAMKVVGVMLLLCVIFGLALQVRLGDNNNTMPTWAYRPDQISFAGLVALHVSRVSDVGGMG